jgi:membrane protease subunit (stomatin/prohibitin family)
MLSCTLPGGVTASCWTDDPMQCQGGNPAGAVACHAECAKNEFLARCGGVGPGPIPDPPAGCRAQGAAPAGIEFFCCPCGA